MKILFVETHFRIPFKENQIRTSAVDWWRIVNPAQYLQKHTDWQVDIQKGIDPDNPFVEGFNEQLFSNVTHKYDVVIQSYFDNALGFSTLMVNAIKDNTKVVLDVDDDLFNISEYNPVYYQYHNDPKRYQATTTILRESPHLTTSTATLKKLCKDFRKGKSTKRMPNLMNLDVYKMKPKKAHDKIVIGYHGGITHYIDMLRTPFYGAMSHILGKYHDKVEFRICGFIPDTEFSEYDNVSWRRGSSDFYEWVKVWQDWTQEIDIGVAPLEMSEFNRSKSNIKVMEYGASKIPTIATNIEPYRTIIRNGSNGMLVSSVKDWVNAFELLINNEEKRRSMGEQIYKDIENNFNINYQGKIWKEYLENLK